MASERPVVVEINATRFNMESPSLFWPRTFDDRLLGSLEQNGQLVPVLATFDGDTPCLLAGQRRVKALARLGRPVQTMVLNRVSALERGIVYLESNSSEILDEGARIRALRYFSACMEDLTPLAQILGLSSRSRQWSLLRAWLVLPESWDELLVRGHVPLVLARHLARFAPDDLLCIYTYFRDMSWSRNNAVFFVTWIWEASRRKGCSPETLMDALDLAGIRALNLSPRDTMIRLMEAVRTARYPALCAREKALQKRFQHVMAGSRWRLGQPDNFETRSVELSTRITSRDDLEQRVRELTRIARDPVWTDLHCAEEERKI